MLRPERFGFDPETAATNVFQRDTTQESLVGEEFDHMVDSLRKQGIDVDVWTDDPERNLPNAVFLNNWFSTHPDGTLVLYPMLTSSRKREVRPELLHAHHLVKRTLDLSQEPTALEGTGSLVFDHLVKRAFLVPSERSDPYLAKELCETLGYDLITREFMIDDKPVYHTNVVLSVGPTRVLAAEPFLSEDFGERTVIPLTEPQIRAFAGNAIELGDTLLLSLTGWSALTPTQQESLGNVTVIPVPTIETLGGGSVRCMVAENYLRPKQDSGVALGGAANPDRPLHRL